MTRALALSLEALAAELDELGFAIWCRSTLFPQAVNRWIQEVSHA